MGKLLHSVQPVLDSAIKSHAGGDANMRGQARLLAIKAVKKFDPQRGVKLRTYLHTQLQPLQRTYTKRTAMTSVPERVSLERFRMTQAEDEIKQTYGREASDQELADKLGIGVRRIDHIRSFGRGSVPESAVVDREGEMMLPGTQKNNPEMVWLEYLHHDLNPIDQKIMEWKLGLFGKDRLGTGEIARRLGITPSAVSQRSTRILAQLDQADTERNQTAGQVFGIRT